MTMYGAPFSSVPTSITRATCSLLIFTAARASRAKRADGLAVGERRRQEELERDLARRAGCGARRRRRPCRPTPRTRSTRYLPARTSPSRTPASPKSSIGPVSPLPGRPSLARQARLGLLSPRASRQAQRNSQRYAAGAAARTSNPDFRPPRTTSPQGRRARRCSRTPSPRARRSQRSCARERRCRSGTRRVRGPDGRAPAVALEPDALDVSFEVRVVLEHGARV